MLVVSACVVFGEEQKPAEEPKVTGSFATAFLSQYVFRGFELSSHSLVIQPSVTLSYRGFNLNIWGNYDSHETTTQSFVPDNPGKAGWDETDITLSYTYAVDKWAFTGGYIYYATDYFPQAQELFLSVGYDIVTKPVLSVYQNVANYPATYLNLALSHSLPVYKDISLDLGASFWALFGQSAFWKTYEGSTGAYTGSKFSNLLSGMLSAGVTITIVKNFSVQPTLQYWFPLSNDARKKVDGVPYNPAGNINNTVVYGLNAMFTF
jgi:hypothetical protein